MKRMPQVFRTDRCCGSESRGERMNDEAMIQAVVEEVFARLHERQQERSVLIVATQEPPEDEIRSWSVNRNVEVRSPDEADGHEADEVWFYAADQSLVVKTALGLDDSKEAALCHRYLREGRRVTFLLDERMTGFHTNKGLGAVNPTYLRMMTDHLQTVASFGVELTCVKGRKAGSGQFDDRFSGTLLTENEIKQWPSDTVVIAPSTIVTPLAKDAARSRAITIQRRER